MNNNIGVGLVVGLATASSIFIYKSEKFTKLQKVILLICILFVPLQWLLTAVILIINHYKLKNLPENIRKKRIQDNINAYDSKIATFQELKNKGLLTDSELNEKTEILEKIKFNLELEKSDNYIKLKSLLDENLLTQEEFDNKVQSLNGIKATENIELNRDDTLKLKKAGFGCFGTIVVFIILYWLLGKFM